MTARILVGTAGWSVPRLSAHRSAAVGSHLERYSRVLPCVEINSSFYRSHARSTYERWAASTPPDFRFSVKMPRAITHDRQLRRVEGELRRFLDECRGLGSKRGAILVQLPASVAFDARMAARFFRTLRSLDEGAVVCEPRSPTWFSAAAERLLERLGVARVAADPPRAPAGDSPAGWPGRVYFRLHGAPRTYWSRYGTAYLDRLAATVASMADGGVEAWVIFDNTAGGTAFENACELGEALEGLRGSIPGLRSSGS
jgi:uncharacterized protein YecE (DUF72 family)